jgi:metallo-beta-lactamase family protein
MKIKFLGGSTTVTGSNYLVHANDQQFIVDFGLYQETNSYELNRQIDFDPTSLDFMILTHAHIDHSGRIPLLYQQGFKKKIITTYATMDLAAIMLEDSAKIQSYEAEAGVGDPLYSLEDAKAVMSYFYPINYDDTVNENGIEINFNNAGHILGSASVQVKGDEKSVIFSGDVGSGNNPLLDQPKNFNQCDALIIESTYGDSFHEDANLRIKKLADILLKVQENKELALIPSFSVGRTQGLIYELKQLIQENKKYQSLKKLDFYLDSPLGLKATDIYLDRRDYLRQTLDFNRELFKMDNLHYVTEFEETFSILNRDNPKVIISSNGMLNGGKINFYLERYLDDPKLNIIFIGYQAEETRGREVLEGKSTIMINKKVYENKAKVHNIKGFSGHADQGQLLAWLDQLKVMPEKIFITHGEQAAREFFKKRLESKYDCDVMLPSVGDMYDI